MHPSPRPARPFLALHALLLLLLAFALLRAPHTAQAEPPDLDLPRGFVQEAVANGLTRPTAFALAPDGRIFVAEKAGVVRVIDGNGLRAQPWLDISVKVNTFFDWGLDGIAVDPRWPRAPYLYLAYSYEPPEAQGHSPEGARVSRVVRVTASSNLNLGDPASELVLVGKNSTFAYIGNPDEGNRAPYTCTHDDGSYVRDCAPNEGNSHMLSQLGFGPDGALYVSSGDGINYNWANLRAQSIDSLAGKILRVNPANGDGYASNPFYDGDAGSNRSKVFALGVRNPWRFTFQPGTGILFAADVGNHKWEEINRVPSGANLGWPCFEGRAENAFDPECQPLLSGAWPVTHGVYVYPHGNKRGAAIGGDFVRGNNFPAIYRGAYFYSDFDSATIDYLLFDARGEPTSHVFTAPALAAIQFTFGSDGALYVLYHFNGTLARIRYVGAPNRPPFAVAQAKTSGDPASLAVQFEGSNSSDPDGDRLNLRWDFGDGQSTSEHNPLHTYAEPGVYRATLTVSDLVVARQQTMEIRVGPGAPAAFTGVSVGSPTGGAGGPVETQTSAEIAQPTEIAAAPAADSVQTSGHDAAERAAVAGSGRIVTEGAPQGGARILLRAGRQFDDRWAAVQWQDGQGRWQTVDGWQGTVVNGYQRWWVGKDLYAAGPFRWVILDRKGGALLVASEPFDLPAAHDKMAVWEVP